MKGNNPDKTQTLTEFDKQHACGGNRSLVVGAYALEIACVCGVQVSDTEARPVRRGAVRHPARLLHHRSVVLQPAHSGRRVAGDAAEKLGRVAQRGGDVVHGSFQTDEERSWNTQTGRNQREDAEGRKEKSGAKRKG